MYNINNYDPAIIAGKIKKRMHETKHHSKNYVTRIKSIAYGYI